jgi:hypothetical protein
MLQSLILFLSCRIFEHFAILPDPVTEFIKLRSTLHRQGAILVPKQKIRFPFYGNSSTPFMKREYYHKTGSSNADPDPLNICTI